MAEAKQEPEEDAKLTPQPGKPSKTGGGGSPEPVSINQTTVDADGNTKIWRLDPIKGKSNSFEMFCDEKKQPYIYLENCGPEDTPHNIMGTGKDKEKIIASEATLPSAMAKLQEHIDK